MSEVFLSCYKRTGRVVLVNDVVTINTMYESGGNKLFTDIKLKKKSPSTFYVIEREKEKSVVLFPLSAALTSLT